MKLRYWNDFRVVPSYRNGPESWIGWSWNGTQLEEWSWPWKCTPGTGTQVTRMVLNGLETEVQVGTGMVLEWSWTSTHWNGCMTLPGTGMALSRMVLQEEEWF